MNFTLGCMSQMQKPNELYSLRVPEINLTNTWYVVLTEVDPNGETAGTVF